MNLPGPRKTRLHYGQCETSTTEQTVITWSVKSTWICNFQHVDTFHKKNVCKYRFYVPCTVSFTCCVITECMQATRLVTCAPFPCLLLISIHIFTRLTRSEQYHEVWGLQNSESLYYDLWGCGAMGFDGLLKCYWTPTTTQGVVSKCKNHLQDCTALLRNVNKYTRYFNRLFAWRRR
jgi:hypothetical protein